LCGNIALIGAPWDDGDWEDSGSVYVFGYDPVSGTWNQETKLLPTDDGPGDAFGFSIAFDGEVALIGTPYYYDAGLDTGATFVFRYDPGSGTWTEEAMLIPSDGAGSEFFGDAVALSGNRALIGAPADDDNGYWSGSVYLFEYDPGSSTWTEIDKFLASDGGMADWFGDSVALEGDTALIGASSTDDSGFASGSAYVFEYDSTSGAWIEEQKLLASDGAENYAFGQAVTLSGHNAVITSIGDYVDGPYSGSAYLFVYDPASGEWLEDDKFLVTDGRSWKRFGTAAVLSGETALIAAQFDREIGPASGSIYFFDITVDPPEPDIKVDGQDGPLTIPSTQTVSMTVSLDPGDQRMAHDWWVAGVQDNTFLYCWTHPVGWQYCANWKPVRAYNGKLLAISDFLISQSAIPVGSWKFVFAVDELNNGYEGTYLDSIHVTSQ